MDNREDNHELSLSLGEVYRGDNYSHNYTKEWVGNRERQPLENERIKVK